MALFAAGSGKFINEFSAEFEKTFMEILKRRARHTKVLANAIYNELIRFASSFSTT
jgi:hypothetical protein